MLPFFNFQGHRKSVQHEERTLSSFPKKDGGNKWIRSMFLLLDNFTKLDTLFALLSIANDVHAKGENIFFYRLSNSTVM